MLVEAWQATIAGDAATLRIMRELGDDVERLVDHAAAVHDAVRGDAAALGRVDLVFPVYPYARDRSGYGWDVAVLATVYDSMRYVDREGGDRDPDRPTWPGIGVALVRFNRRREMARMVQTINNKRARARQAARKRKGRPS